MSGPDAALRPPGAHRRHRHEPGAYRRDPAHRGGVLLLLLAAAQGYVSFRAQYTFIDHAKRAHVPSMLEALGLDTGAVIFALLALSLARRGRRGTVERVLNVACALGSMVMNLLAADLTSPRSVTVWVMPSVLYALASDRLIAVVRRWVRSSAPGSPARPGEFGLAGSRRRLVLWLADGLASLRTALGFRSQGLPCAAVAPKSPRPGPRQRRTADRRPTRLQRPEPARARRSAKR